MVFFAACVEPNGAVRIEGWGQAGGPGRICRSVGPAAWLPIWRGVGPAGVGVSASRPSSLPRASWPSSTAARWVRVVIDRSAADVDELARARRVQDLDTAAVLPDRRPERRRRLAEPDLEFRAFCTRRRLSASSTSQLERAWDAWQAERYQRGEISQRPCYADNPFRPR